MIPIIYIYRKLPRLIPEPIKDKKTLINYSFYVIAIIVFAILMNVAITQLGLMKESTGFTEASETLLDGTIWVQVLCNAIVIPILEETLFRGIIAGQLYMWHGIYVATIFSAICFGISHFNIVQFLYAFIVGLGLGFLYCKTKRLSLCIIAHSLVNLIVIIFT
ncbi:MAG: CPBP family intramembrane metalloprotease [Pseudobutyrivibrio sp.]|nr:CPBP family intramembrane metalloprotease [Pseudobutyrivibrio sp.]